MNSSCLGSHDDMALFGINLGIQSCVTNEVHNPSFCFFWCHVQLVCKHTDADALVYSAKSFEDEQSSILNEII